MVYFVRGLQRRSQALIKGRLFEGFIGLRGDSMVYLFETNGVFCSRL